MEQHRQLIPDRDARRIAEVTARAVGDAADRGFDIVVLEIADADRKAFAKPRRGEISPDEDTRRCRIPIFLGKPGRIGAKRSARSTCDGFSWKGAMTDQIARTLDRSGLPWNWNGEEGFEIFLGDLH